MTLSWKCCRNINATRRSLRELYIRSNTGKMVPLAAVSEVKQTVAPLTVSHIGQLPAINFQFDLKPGVALSEATAMIDKAAASINLPSTVIFSYQGTTAAFQDSLRGLGILLLIAVLVIYLVLGVLYESFIHPITILSGLPAAGLGALITLLLFGLDLNLYSFVGLILLIGIVKKNAIMMIDFALCRAAQRRQIAGGSDCRRLFAALPAHHDDHHGGFARHFADRVRNRRGRRSAAAIGYRGRGRLGGFAAADALHHAGDLPVSRPLGYAQKAHRLNSRISSTGSTRVSRKSLPIEAGLGPLRAAREQTPLFR